MISSIPKYLACLCIFIAGCAAHRPKVVPAFPSVENLLPPALPQRVVRSVAQPRSVYEPPHYRLEWDYVPNGDGPVWFEIWVSDKLLAQSVMGTNIPAGYTHWTNVVASPVPIVADQAARFYIIRTANNYGFSDWAH